MDYTSIKTWVLHRLQEKSTWIGIVTVALTLTGATLAPAKQEAIETIGVAVASMALVGTKERSTDPVKNDPLVKAAIDTK